MRSAKETGCFPYSSGQVCYMEVSPDGAVTQLSTVGEKRSAYINAQAGVSKSKASSENTDDSAERRIARMKIFCLKGVPP